MLGISLLAHKLDIFKAPFLLRISGKEKISTLLGLFFSLGILIFLAVFFFNSDIFYHIKPTIIDQELLLSHKAHLDFNGENFGLVAALVDDPGNVYNDDTIFSISITQYVLNCSTHESIFEDRKQLHPCDENDSPWDPSIIDNYGLRNYSCPNNKTFAVEGGWDEPIINHIYITISLCKNETSNNSCKSYAEMAEFLSGKYASISYMDFSFDLNNYANPMQSQYKNLWWTLGADLRKTAVLYFKKVELITDSGFLFRDLQTLESFQRDQNYLDVDLNYKEFIFQAEIYSSPKKKTASRTYQKIQEVIASIGGLLSLFVSIGFIITGPQTRLNVIKAIMNNLYIFHRKRKDKNLNKEKADSGNKILICTNTLKNDFQEINLIDPEFPTPKEEKFPTLRKSPFFKGEDQAKKKVIELMDMSINAPPSNIKITTRKSHSCLLKQPALNRHVERENITLRNSSKLHSKTLSIDDCVSKKRKTRTKSNILESEGRINIIQKSESEERIIENNPKFNSSPSNATKEHSRDRLYELPSFNVQENVAVAKIKKEEDNLSKVRKSVEKMIELETKEEDGKKDFGFSLFEYFKYNMKRFLGLELNFKEKLFKKTEKYFYREVDLISLLSKIHEIDKMKLLIFNKRQQVLFNLLSKPMIFVDQQHMMANKKFRASIENDPGFRMTKLMKEGKKAKGKNETLLECFDETIRQKEIDPIDERLMFFIEQKAAGRNLEVSQVRK